MEPVSKRKKHRKTLERISSSHRKVCEGKRDSYADVAVLD